MMVILMLMMMMAVMMVAIMRMKMILMLMMMVAIMRVNTLGLTILLGSIPLKGGDPSSFSAVQGGTWYSERDILQKVSFSTEPRNYLTPK